MIFNPLRNPAIRRAIYNVLQKYKPAQSISIASLSDDYITKELISSGWYEKPFLELLKCLFSSRDANTNLATCAIDIGANIGNHSLFLAKMFETIISVEPNPVCVNLLKASIEVNDITNIRIIPKGLGSKVDVKPLNFSGNHTGGGSFLEAAEITNTRSVNINIDTLDNVTENILDPDVDIQFIKIDAEGFEVAVINGAKKTLGNHSPVIAFEAHGIDRYEEVTSTLKELGYKSFYKLTQSRRMHNFFLLNAINMLLKPNTLKIQKITQPDDCNYQMVIAFKEIECEFLDNLGGYFKC